MIDQSRILEHYQRMRDVRYRLNMQLIRMIPKKTLDDCGKLLGFIQKGIMVFETEDESALLMDYCVYYPEPDGRNVVAKFLEKSPPEAPDELTALRAMNRSYYSVFQVVGVKRGLGVEVRDLFREETSFLVDVGLGSSARQHMILATRVIPMDGYLMTTGAGLPIDSPTGEQIFKKLIRARYDPETLDFKRITPQQEAEITAIVIRECRSSGVSSRIAYEDPGAPAQLQSSSPQKRHVGRNEPCPCGSGKKFKVCCNPDRY